MKQSDVEAALKAFYQHGDLDPWRRILEAAKTDEVLIEVRPSSVIIKVNERPALKKLGDALEELRGSTDLTQKDVADELGISLSAVIRLVSGLVLPQWPTVRMFVEVCGGDSRDYREDYETARQEVKRARAKKILDS